MSGAPGRRTSVYVEGGWGGVGEGGRDISQKGAPPFFRGLGVVPEVMHSIGAAHAVLIERIYGV